MLDRDDPCRVHDAGDASGRYGAQQQLALLETSVARLNDIVLITEADRGGAAGPAIVFVNDAFEHITGYRREEVLGKSVRFLHGPLTDRDEVRRIGEALENQRPVRSELVNYSKDGEPFWLELDVVPVTDANGRYTHCVAVERDVTRRKEADLELARLNRALRVRSACNEALIRATDEDKLLHEICRVAVELGGYQTAWVGFAQDSAERAIRPMACAGDGADAFDDSAATCSDEQLIGSGPFGRALRGRQVVIVEDLRNAPDREPWAAVAAARGYRSLVVLPLHDAERTYGIFALFGSDVARVASDEMRLLQELADDLAFGIATLRSRCEQRRTEEAVFRIAAGVSASTGTAFFDELVRNMTAALGADAGFIARIRADDPRSATTVVAYVEGERIENFEYPLVGTPCEQLAKTATHVIPTRVSELFPCTAQLSKWRAHAYVGHRLEDSRGQAIGQLFVLFSRPLHETAFITSTLQIFASRVAAELERQSADAHIRRQASLLDKAQDAIMVRGLDDAIRYWNKGAERLYGWEADEVTGRSTETLLYGDPTAFRENTRRVIEHGEWNGEIMQLRKDGTPLVVEAHWTLLRDENDQPDAILAINTNVTERKAAEHKVHQLAFYDPLTGLPNRELVGDRLQHAMQARHGQVGALLLIDLDNFKTLNDTLGHAMGDLLLQQIAQRLHTCLRKGDTLARVGGDEFVIVLEGLSASPGDAGALATRVGEKILASFAQPFQLAEYVHHCTASIGITLFNDRPTTLDELRKRADLAMYQAKAHGRNALRFFDPAMQAVVAARAALEADLREALRLGAFELHYQAQVDARGCVSGAEALLRWQHPQRGWIAPASFIPLAEETGLILPLGLWVLDVACAQLVAWSTMPHMAGLSLAVNVSARQFRQADFAAQVLAAIERSGADPRRLKLELTESLMLDNLDDTILKMSALKAHGIGFSLDDFGTGYSSLAYLKRLPLDEIKIDQSFVRDVLIDANDASIARSILALGQSLNLEVVAEGVETDAQHAFLAEHGCQAYQGYLFNRPQPALQFEAWGAGHRCPDGAEETGRARL